MIRTYTLLKSLLGTCVSLLLLLAAASTVQAQPFAYITSTSNSVSVINTATNTVIASVPVGGSPIGVAVNPGGSRAYIANDGSNTVSVINTLNNTVIATIPVGTNPRGIALSADGTRVYTANQTSATVSVIDTATNMVIASPAAGATPYAIAINPAGTRLYVGSAGASGIVSVINTATNAVVATVPAPNGVRNLVVNPAGTFVYVTSFPNDNVSAIDTATNMVVATVVVGDQPIGVAVNPAGTRAYVANSNSASVSVIDTAINTVVATVPVGNGPTGISVDPTGTRVYTANASSDNVSVIDTATNMVVATVPVGNLPQAIGKFIGGPSSIAPGAPTGVTAVAGDGTATVNYSPPAFDGGSMIFNYTATSTPGGITANTTGGPIIVTGLTNGTPYTFTVTATNSSGTGPASAPSNSVTPLAALVACQFTAMLGAWNVAGNWANCSGGDGVPAGTPGPSNRAEVSGGRTAVLPSGVFTVGDLYLGASTLQGAGPGATTLNVVAAGGIAWGSGSYTFQDITAVFTSTSTIPAANGPMSINNAVLELATPSTAMAADSIVITGVGAKILNSGVFHPSGSLSMTLGGNFENTASGFFYPLVPVTINGTFLNRGGFLVDPGVVVTLSLPGSFLQSDPTAFISGAGTISAAGQTLTVANGFIEGNLTFNLGTLNNTGAILLPGGAGGAGTITVNGNYTVNAAGGLEIDIAAGMPSPVFDRLVVSGSTTLTNASVNFSYFDDGFGTYVPTIGDALSFHTSGALTGLFTSFNAPVSANVVSLSHSAAGAQFVVTAPTVTVTGTTTFPSTAVGGTSAVQNITITNTGATTFTFSLTHSNPALFRDTYFGDPRLFSYFWCFIGADVSGAPLTGSRSIVPGSTCTLQLVFKPTALGLNTADIVINSTTTSESVTINLTGTGVTGNPPSTPGTPFATAQNGYAVVSVVPSADTGFSITGYTVTSSPPGGFDSNAGSSASPHVVTGLTNGTAYTFTVVAANGVGASAPSPASNAVTPTTPTQSLPAAISQVGLLAYYPFSTSANNLMGGPPFQFEPTNATILANSLNMTGIYAGASTTGVLDGVDYRTFSTIIDFKFASLPTNGTILTHGTSFRSIELGLTAAFEPRITLNGGASTTNFTGQTLALNTWHRAIMVVDVSALQITLYVNGVQQAPIALPGGFAFDASFSIFNPSDRNFSFFNFSNGGAFKGDLNNLLVYGRALSSAEALAINGLLPPPGVGGTAPIITSAAPPNGIASTAYTHTFTATGTTPITWTIVTGAQPTGLTLNATSGILSGTPTTAGTFTFTIQAANGTLPNAQQFATILIIPPAPVITSAATAGGVSGSAFTYQITATNTPTSFGATGLPAGLTVNNATGQITGTPSLAGTFSATITATNAAGTGSQALTITVSALLPPTISFAVVPTSITVGGTSVGTLTINNPNAVPQTANPVLFNYLPGLVNAPAPNASSTCVGANITATPGAGSYTQNTTFTLPASGSCTFSATITSNTAGTYSGNIAAGLIVTPAGSSNATPFNITVTPAPTPAVTLTPPSVNFGTRTVNTTSPPTTVTLGNSGSALLTIASITASGDFAFTTTCPLGPSTLAVGIGCPIDITFTPLAATLRNGGIAITSNAPGSPHTITLSGTGSAAAVPGISINPATLIFGAQTVNTTSATQNVVVTNTGFANLTLSSITVSAPFGRVPLGSVTPPDCGASVAPGSSCQIGVNFGPTAAGVQTGQISIIDNATGSPHSVPLTGTGAAIPVAVINATAAVAFGDQVINSPAVTRVITIDNTGTIPLTISAITLTGTNAANYTVTGQSGCVSIAPGASCTLTVSFTTTVTGARTAQVSIASNAQNAATVNIPLTANGILAPRAVVSLSATAVGYGNVIFGGATPNQIITLTNGGAQAMTISSIVITGDFVQMNNCGTSLASLASCTISILFTPLGQGSRFGEFILTTSAASSPDRIQLSGTGCRWFSQAQSRFFLTSCG